jgi:hypothetical protein
VTRAFRRNGARPSEGEREENRIRSGDRSFVVPPPRTSTGQQEQEDVHLFFREVPRGSLASRWSVAALVRETGAPAAGLCLG